MADERNIEYITWLLERIAYNTSQSALEFDKYIEDIAVNDGIVRWEAE